MPVVIPITNLLWATLIGSLRPLLKESRTTFSSRCCQRGQIPASNNGLLIVCHILLLEKLPLTCSAWLLQVLLQKEVIQQSPFKTSQPTCSRQSPEIGFYQEQCTTADFYSSGWHWLGWHWWQRRPQRGQIHSWWKWFSNRSLWIRHCSTG